MLYYCIGLFHEHVTTCFPVECPTIHHLNSSIDLCTETEDLCSLYSNLVGFHGEKNEWKECKWSCDVRVTSTGSPDRITDGAVPHLVPGMTPVTERHTGRLLQWERFWGRLLLGYSLSVLVKVHRKQSAVCVSVTWQCYTPVYCKPLGEGCVCVCMSAWMSACVCACVCARLCFLTMGHVTSGP